MKATYCEIDGKGKEIFKSPKTTDGGMPKKSLRGLISVVRTFPDNDIVAIDRVDSDAETHEEVFETPVSYKAGDKEYRIKENMLKTVFEDGKIVSVTTFDEIRERHNKAMLDSIEFQDKID